MRFVFLLAAAGAGLSFSAIAAGEDAAGAREAFEEGKGLFVAGEYADAADAFRRANELNPNWRLLYNIAQSEAAAKRYGLALEAFERYLAAGGDEVDLDRQEEVLAEVRRLREMVGVLEVSGRDGDQVEVNGLVRGSLPEAARVKVGMGEVTVRLLRGGEEVLAQRLVVSGGETVSVGEGDGPGGEAPGAGDAGGKKGLRTWGWVSLGVGAAVLAGGAATGGVALSMNGDLNDQCGDGTCTTQDKQDDLDKRDGLATASTVLLAVGGVAAATGVVLLVLGSIGKEKPGAGAGGGELSLAPSLGPGFAGAAITGRF